MKSKREHRVPLVHARAREILEQTHESRPFIVQTGFFPSPTGRTLSDSTLSKLLRELGDQSSPARIPFEFSGLGRRMHRRTACSHGSRALSHVVKNKAEAAYARSDLFERRRALMNDWSSYLA